MDIFNRFKFRATFYASALFLCSSFAASADEIQDISKLNKQGQQQQALKRIDGYLANKPKDAQARFLKGLILSELDKTDMAIKMFSSLTEEFPELPEPYNNLAVLYASLGKYDKARIALEMAIRTHPSYATAHENLGDIYAKMASRAYNRALQLNHSNNATKTKLAMIKNIFTIIPNKRDTAPKNSHPTAFVAASVAKADVASPQTISPHPAATGKTITAGTTSATDNSDEVLSVVQEWAAAWSAQNVEKYLTFYAVNFKTPNGMSRTSWEAQRDRRLVNPKSISVKISNAVVTFSDVSHAKVIFHQSYRATHLKSLTRKTLTLAKSGDNWQILEEHTGR